jgi:glycosyltransferase involved in cell wall biosynthesis
MLPLSVIIPVKNEALNLSACLTVIAGWADEIIVADSNSTDGTQEIAKQFGATVIQFNYEGGWPKKRQWVLDTYPIRNEWVLLLDADEILLDPLKF